MGGESGRVFVQLLPHNDKRYQRWRQSLIGKQSWAKGKTKFTDFRLLKTSQTMKAMKLDNFKHWRDKQKELGIVVGSWPRLKFNKDRAFLHGLMLGDGHIEQFPRTQRLYVTLNDKYPLLINLTCEVITRVFGKKPVIQKSSISRAVYVNLYQKHISRRLGIPSGNKGGLVHSLPRWISNSDMLSIWFLKGLFEAEGSLSIHLPTSTYNFAFSNTNQSLLNIVFQLLIRFGFHPEKRELAVRLRRRKEVEYFRQLISFRE